MAKMTGLGIKIAMNSIVGGIEMMMNKLELSSAKLRRLMKLCWKKFYEMIFDSLEAILKDPLSGFIKYLK